MKFLAFFLLIGFSTKSLATKIFAADCAEALSRAEWSTSSVGRYDNARVKIIGVLGGDLGAVDELIYVEVTRDRPINEVDVKFLRDVEFGNLPRSTPRRIVVAPVHQTGIAFTKRVR